MKYVIEANEIKGKWKCYIKTLYKPNNKMNKIYFHIETIQLPLKVRHN